MKTHNTRSKTKNSGLQPKHVRGGPEDGAPGGGMQTPEGKMVHWGRKPEEPPPFAPGSKEYHACEAHFNSLRAQMSGGGDSRAHSSAHAHASSSRELVDDARGTCAVQEASATAPAPAPAPTTTGVPTTIIDLSSDTSDME